MGDHDDKAFMKRFSGIIAGLVIATILIIIISVGNDRQEEDNNPSRAILAAERVEPVAGVRTELPVTKPGPITVEPEPDVVLAEPEDQSTSPEETATGEATETAGGIDGGAIYASACAACHIAGVAGAPVPGSDAWAERAARGADALVDAAIAGVGPIMMPRGGRADLSDEEIRAAVEHMLAQ